MELVEVTLKDGKKIKVLAGEVEGLKKLGKVKELKAKTQTKEKKEPVETKEEEKPKGPMSKERNLKNVKSGD